MNEEVWESPALFPAAVIVYGVAEAAAVEGTVNEQEKSPLPKGLTAQVAGLLSTGAPLTVTCVSEPANPVPETVNFVPTGPWLGVIVTTGIVPVKVVVAASLAVRPVAVTVFRVPGLTLNVNPLEPVGENVHDPPPEPAVVIVQRDVEFGLVMAMLASVDAKPLAVAVTVIPDGPEDGLNVRVATVPV